MLANKWWIFSPNMPSSTDDPAIRARCVALQDGGGPRWRLARSGAVFAAFCALGGCSSFPNQVAAPSIKFPATQAGAKADYKVGGNSIGYQSGSQGASTILPVETTLPGIQTQILAMQAAYLSQQEKLLLEVDTVSNLQFFGMIASAAGIATKSNAWRNGGAGVAGLSNLWSSHYGIAVQATNYGLASQALDCVSGEIDYITPSFWLAAYDGQGVFQIPKENFTIAGASAADVTVAYDTLANMYPNLHKTVVGIDRKLRALQASIQIPTVSVSDIQDAVANKAAAKNAGDAATEKAKQGARQAADNLQVAANQARQKAAASQVEAVTAAQGFQAAKFNAQAQRQVVQATAQNESQMRVNFMALQTVDLPSEIASADEKIKNQYVEQKKQQLPAAKAKSEQALITLATESAKQAPLDALENAAQQAAQQKSAKAAQDAQAANDAVAKADAAKKFVDLLNLGVVSKAVQLPSSLSACVAVMGN